MSPKNNVLNQTQPRTPTRTYNKDQNNFTPVVRDDNSEHTPTTTRYVAKNFSENSFFGGNDNLPDYSMRFTTTYRQFTSGQRFTGNEEGEEGGGYLQSI